jgi:hypothetical protein
MLWRIGVLLSFLLSALLASAHEPIGLDARRATPGLQLELDELPPTTTLAAKKYRLKAVGLPSGIIFSVWAKDFGHSFHELASGFYVDESGNLVSSEPSGTERSMQLDKMVFGPGPYPRGAVWEVAVVSADRALTAFAQVIPHPITARSGPCKVALELVSHRGNRFMASGAGFAPSEDVVTELRYAEQVIQKRQRISPEGLLPSDIILHGSSSAERSARYTVKGHSCDVTVEYEWGEPALSRR